MQPRQLGIIGIAALVAFAAAFLISSSGGGSEPESATAAAETRALEAGEAPGVGSVSTQSAPGLKVPARKTPTPEADNNAATPAPTTNPGNQATPARTAVPNPTAVRTPKPQPTPEPTIGGGED